MSGNKCWKSNVPSTVRVRTPRKVRWELSTVWAGGARSGGVLLSPIWVWCRWRIRRGPTTSVLLEDCFFSRCTHMSDESSNHEWWKSYFPVGWFGANVYVLPQTSTWTTVNLAEESLIGTAASRGCYERGARIVEQSSSNNRVTISLRSISALRANTRFLGALLFVPRRIFDSSETKKKRYNIKFYCASCIHHGWLWWVDLQVVEMFARCDTVFLNRCSDAAGESSLDIAISLFQLGIPHSPVWYSCVSRRYWDISPWMLRPCLPRLFVVWDSQLSTVAVSQTIPLNLAKIVKIFPGIIVRRHTPIRNSWNCRKTSAHGNGRHLCCIAATRSESWWADSMECYTYLRNVTDLSSDGKTPYARRFGQPFKGPIFPVGSLVEYHLSLRRTSQESINLERKSYLDCSSDTHCTQGELEGWRTGCTHWGVGDDGRIGNLLKKTQCARGVLKKRRIYFSDRRWTNQTPWRRSGTENVHLDTAATNSKRKSPWFSWRITRISCTTSRLFSGCRWSDKWFLVHVRKLHVPPSRWTWSQTLLSEKRIIPYSTEIHWCIENYSYEFGCQARETHRWLLEYRWIKRLVWSMDRFHSVYSFGRKLPNGYM